MPASAQQCLGPNDKHRGHSNRFKRGAFARHMECYGQGSHGSRIVDWLGLFRAFRAHPTVFLILPAPDMAALPYIIASTVIHWGYYFSLIAAYKHSDLSLAYPIARGAAPVLIALGATIWPREILSPMA